MATLTNKTTTEYAFKTPIAIHSCTCTTYNFHGAAPTQTVRFGKMLVVLEDFAKMPMVKPSQIFYKVAPVTNESTGQLEGKFVAVPNCSMYFLLDKRKGFFVFRTAKTPEIAYRMCSDALQSFDDPHNTSYIRQITDSTSPSRQSFGSGSSLHCRSSRKWCSSFESCTSSLNSRK